MKDIKAQLISALLFILTVAAVSCAVINFRQQSIYRQPDDGVIWVDRTPNILPADATKPVAATVNLALAVAASTNPANVNLATAQAQAFSATVVVVSQISDNMVVARDVKPGSQGDKAGIRPGDILIGIAGFKIAEEKNVPQALERVGAWSKPAYRILRDAVELSVPVVVDEIVTDSAIYYQYAVGLFYLTIGLFVYYRRVGAPRAVHFYVLCLASFILYTFHYTRKLNTFDQVIYTGNVLAWIVVPAIFLHFCLVYPERRKWLKSWVRVALIYLPAAILLTTHILLQFVADVRIYQKRVPLIEVREITDRVELAYLVVMYLLGTIALTLQFRNVEDAVVARQLKYMRNGAILGVLPFAAIYVIPFLFGAHPGHYQGLAVLSLVLIPITWAYAILRYRLMDVDIIFQQGYVYTLATLAVIGVFYGVLVFFAPDSFSPLMIVGLILFATFIFQPIRNWIQEQLDRYFFYKDRYDYRRTLIEFGRELSSETNLETMLAAVADRLVHTLSIQHVAFFLAREHEDNFELHTTMGQRKHGPAPADPDLTFLSKFPDKPYLFFERTRHVLDVIAKEWPASVRSTITDLDLTYYFACSIRGRTIAYLGLSRTDKGDFLSSDDVELLTTLSGYVGIAIENARLYRSLQRKVEEYERLKDFSENIVESINVGILAADLDDRVESWNTQIERLTGIARDAAVGRRLSELFPPDLVELFDQVRGQTGVHNVYKFVLNPHAAATASNGNGNGASHSPQPTSHTLNLAIAPLVSKDLEQIGRLVIFDDITDRDELERRLVQADKLSSIGLLAAGVAHEVNTPLAVISTYAQMLAKQISGDDQKSKLLEKIAKQTFRASEIVNSLLNFSRTSTTDFVEIDLNRTIRETLTLIEHQLQKASVEVQVRFEESLPAVKGNAGKLQQVFLNLFLNARDAMDRGGILAVRTSAEGSMARIEVADTGQGIPPENMARIYDPFFTTKGARKGTGLGLSVTYGIVREHGGTIEVDSQPGAGTRFQVELPLVRKMAHAR